MPDRPTRPAEPLLASQILSEEEVDRLIAALLFDEEEADSATREKKDGRALLATGIKSVDDALGGGLQGGRVVGVNEQLGAGGGEVCRAWLVSALCSKTHTTAAVIDTTGNFDVLGLYALILAKLRQDTQVLDVLRDPVKPGESMEDVAARTLDRVKIMRVFDFVGVREAISEIREELEGKVSIPAMKEVVETDSRAKKEEAMEVKIPPRRTFVADSEDEDDDIIDDGEEEMLFDSSPSPVQQQHRTPTDQPAPATPSTNTPTTQPPPHHKPSLILLTPLTPLLTPLFKNSPTQATSLLSPTLHSLSNLTHTHHLTTLLHLPIPPSTTTTPPSRPNPRHTSPSRHRPDIPSPSIFASNTAVPVYMGVLGGYVDLEVLVSRVPKGKGDARVHYAEEGGGGGKKKGKVEMLSVMEVLADRWEGRVGMWGAFGMGRDGGLRAV